MSDFYIQNPWTGLVIDIGENQQNPPRGTMLRANAKKTIAPGNEYQLWTFVEFAQDVINDLINYFFIQNANPTTPLVIDIAEEGNVITRSPGGQTLKAGSRLDAWTMKGASGGLDDNLPGSSNQIWGFVPNSKSAYYFIQNLLTDFVIDIEERGLSHGQPPPAGTYLDAYPQKEIGKNANQLWQFVDLNGTPVTVPGPPSRTIRSRPGNPTGTR